MKHRGTLAFLGVLFCVCLTLGNHAAKADAYTMIYSQEYAVEKRFRVTKYVLPNLRQDEFTRMFRTRIENAGRLGYPNFANHYIIATWGCGTNCQGGAIINTLTGRVMPLPLANYGYLHVLDSQLLAVNPIDPFDKDGCEAAAQYGFLTEYYQVNGNRLTQVGSETPTCYR